MKTLPNIPVFVLVLFTVAIGANAQSTAFTYHGRLNNNDVPVTGAYDMQFAVYDAEVAGQMVAGPPPQNAIEVINGLFRARIDFGAGVFTGPPRWLEIQVRPAGNGNFTTLNPRQELTSSPYSIRAQTAGTAADVSNGSVVKSLNNLRDDITLAAVAPVTLTPNGNTLTISSTGGTGGPWSLNGNDAYYNAGNVGIGTTQPQGLLDLITGASDTSALFVRADPGSFGRGGIIHHQSGTYGWQELAQTTGSPTDGYLAFHYVNRASPATKVSSNVLTLRGNGNVGIGTSLPQGLLDVMTGTSDNSALFVRADPGSFGRGGIIHHQSTTYGWQELAQTTGSPDNGYLTFNYVNRSSPATKIRSDVLTLRGDGNVGVGTTTPAAKLDVAGDVKGTRLILRADPFAAANAAVLCEDPNVVNFVPYNTANNRPLNIIVRDATVRVLTITGGADIAEPFQMSSDDIPKGAVVVIDEEHPGHLKLSTDAYDKRVAGIVSGANGVKPGINLHQEGLLEGGQNVALSGRVYVQADAAFAVIKPGDLLTTSETPGHAMKVTDHAKAQGAILGKAMTGLKEGKGMVLVLVTLQ
jgi:hypothetical protein